MDKYKELISLFSDVLEKSKDYHIAYILSGGLCVFGWLAEQRGRTEPVNDS